MSIRLRVSVGISESKRASIFLDLRAGLAADFRMRLSILLLLSMLIASSSIACPKEEARGTESAELSKPTTAEPATPKPSPKPAAETELLDVLWRIVWLDGKPIAAEELTKPAEVTFDTKEQRVHGSSGCNRFFGTYSLQGSSLGLSQMGATRMACVKGMDKEQQILNALTETGRFEILNSTLQLYDKNDELRMKLIPATPEGAREETP